GSGTGPPVPGRGDDPRDPGLFVPGDRRDSPVCRIVRVDGDGASPVHPAASRILRIAPQRIHGDALSRGGDRGDGSPRSPAAAPEAVEVDALAVSDSGGAPLFFVSFHALFVGSAGGHAFCGDSPSHCPENDAVPHALALL